MPSQHNAPSPSKVPAQRPGQADHLENCFLDLGTQNAIIQLRNTWTRISHFHPFPSISIHFPIAHSPSPARLWQLSCSSLQGDVPTARPHWLPPPRPPHRRRWTLMRRWMQPGKVRKLTEIQPNTLRLCVCSLFIFFALFSCVHLSGSFLSFATPVVLLCWREVHQS